MFPCHRLVLDYLDCWEPNGKVPRDSCHNRRAVAQETRFVATRRPRALEGPWAYRAPRPRIQEPICYLLGELWAFKAPKSRVNPTANHRLTLDLWLAKDNRFLNPKSSYKRILMAPPCRLIQNQLTTIVVPVFDWQLILMESRPWSPGESTFVGNFHMKFHSPGGAIILFLNPVRVPGLSISRVALWPGTNWFPRLMERTRN